MMRRLQSALHSAVRLFQPQSAQSTDPFRAKTSQTGPRRASPFTHPPPPTTTTTITTLPDRLSVAMEP
ncbi:hypothetical protein PBY51_017201 [Eleginops maclovinus]|uniref:Uncharacterized protein n=1 Tax=Eleginops maclovinus TaxID=56733 RepID=A0AAN8AIZ7_ELEMC|nr:hypothetical protein PBY51_017201 [Eleginops maclovinus]